MPISELDYLRGFIDFLQSKGKATEADMHEYNRRFELNNR
jgi:hypothetical protein